VIFSFYRFKQVVVEFSCGFHFSTLHMNLSPF
jgi:hypothetical protein